MSGAQIAVLAVVGFMVYKMYQRKKVEVGLEDLGGGLSDTDGRLHGWCNGCNLRFEEGCSPTHEL